MPPTVARLPALFSCMDPSRPTPPDATATADAGRAEAVTNASISADEQDIIWMMRVRAGDRRAFADLMECHQSRVIGTVARMLGSDSADAEDIGQQVFLRVWKSAARYEPSAKFTTWLYTITRNLVFNELRRRKHRPQVSLEAEFSPAGHGSGREGGGGGDYGARWEDATAPAPDATLLQAELQAAISVAISGLPETQRLALVLRRYEELSYEEIGAVLRLSVPAVKSLLFRARVLLREKLARYLNA